MKDVQTYCNDILTGKIPAGLHTVNTVKRYQIDLLREDLEFRIEEVERVIDFASKLKHTQGKHAGKPFILEPWQKFIVANIYGFYWKETGKRRFNTVYLEMARKNGKTALAALFALFGMFEEPGAEILLAANSKDQAKIAFGAVREFTKSLDPDAKYLKRLRADVTFPHANSFIKVLAADSDKLDGYNCSCGIVDEYHSAPDSSVRDVIRSSQGMRENPLLITITTAGFDKNLPCYELRTVATEIAAQVKTDDTFFGLVYSMDETDDWKDPANWIKSNPNLDVTVLSNYIKTQVTQAVNSPSDEVGIKTKNLNIWCDSAMTWIADQYILQATQKANIADFKGELSFCGVDLASNVDLTAVSYLFVKGEKYYFRTDYYVPTETVNKGGVHADIDLYREWVRRGFLKVTSGNVTDYDCITRDILAANTLNEVERIYYDKFNSLSFVVQATDQGLNLIPYSQAIGNFNVPTKEFERLMLGGQVIIDDNPINRYCLRNVELRTDFNGNTKPMKSSEKKKIDGVIAMLQALAAYLDYSANGGGGNVF
ncbi:MAG TPA: terminase TerL endonuclease subunit [Bacteroidales bacterium]|nr:terminase TerL endonuclease subunit [Bacteroidales bacterium]